MAYSVSSEWHHMPPEVLVQIFSLLSNQDRLGAALTCSDWLEAFRMRALWKKFSFRFVKPNDSRYLLIFNDHGSTLRSVDMVLKLIEENNRQNACRALHLLAEKASRSLSRLEITFEGNNPIMFTGTDLMDGLVDVCTTCGSQAGETNGRKYGLQEVHLAKFRIGLTDRLLDSLALNKYLRCVNLQNEVLLCKLSPEKVVALILGCPHIVDFQCHYTAMSSDALLAFASPDRDPFQFLSLLCKSDCGTTEKFTQELDGEAWKALAAQWPAYRARFTFDHTVPLHLIAPILKPEILLRDLILRTFTRVYEELAQATNFYSPYLEKVMVHTSPSLPLFNALLSLVQRCVNLKSLHVFCSLPHELINKIYNTRPNLKETTDVTLCKEEMGVLVFVGKPQDKK